MNKMTLHTQSAFSNDPAIKPVRRVFDPVNATDTGCSPSRMNKLIGRSAGLVMILIMSGCASNQRTVYSEETNPKGEPVSEWDQLNEDLNAVESHAPFANSSSK